MQLLEEDGLVWGLRLLDTGCDDGNVLRFRTPRVSSSVTKITYKTFALHCVLGGDMAFLNTVLGLQNCSASFPCNRCAIRLSTPRGRKKDMHEAPDAPPARTKEQHQQHLANVLKETAPAKQREASKCNGSVIRPALVPAHFSRVLIAVLHIILGVTKKIFDDLTFDLQDIDSGGECGERMKLVKVRDAIIARAESLKAMEGTLGVQLKDAKLKKYRPSRSTALLEQSFSPRLTNLKQRGKLTKTHAKTAWKRKLHTRAGASGSGLLSSPLRK